MTIPAGPPDPHPNVLVPVLLTTVVLLHLTGSGELAGADLGWASAPHDPVTTAFGALRAVTAMSCHYLLALQTLAFVGRLLGRAGLVGWAHQLTPPPLRTTSRRLAGIGVTAITTLASPLPRAAADPLPGRAVMHAIDPSTSTAAVSVIAPASAEAQGSDQAGRATGETSGERAGSLEALDRDAAAGTATVRVTAVDTTARHVVGPGDHLWSIAETALVRQLGAPADDASIERYWHQLVLANPQLDDPDLVFPGDVIELPPVRHTG